MGTYRIDCHDCEYSKVVFGRDVAEGKSWQHRQDTSSVNNTTMQATDDSLNHQKDTSHETSYEKIDD